MIDVKTSAWSEVAETYLRQAVGQYDIADLKAQHQAGAVLFMVTDDDVPCGAYMLRIDKSAAGLEGVIIAAAGKVNGVNLIQNLLPYIHAQLLAWGCHRARIHTDRHGLIKILGDHQWKIGEFVMFKNLG